MHFQPNISSYTTTITKLQNPLQKAPETAKPLPEDDLAMLTESVEDLWNEIFASKLFSYEQTHEIVKWKTAFLSKYASDISSDDGRDKASLALFYLYKKYLLPCRTQSSNTAAAIKIDGIISLLKLIMGLTLPLTEEVDGYIKRSLAYSDEEDPLRVEFEAQVLMATTAIYEEQIEQLYNLANENRQFMVKNFTHLQSGLNSVCDDKMAFSQQASQKINAIQIALDERLEKSKAQDEALKAQSKELRDLHDKRISLLNQLNQIAK